MRAWAGQPTVTSRLRECIDREIGGIGQQRSRPHGAETASTAVNRHLASGLRGRERGRLQAGLSGLGMSFSVCWYSPIGGAGAYAPAFSDEEPPQPPLAADQPRWWAAGALV